MEKLSITIDFLQSIGPWLHDFELPPPLLIPMDEKLRLRIWQRKNHIIPPILAQYPGGLDGLTVCDLGANAGFWARQLASLGAKVTCVEPRAENITQAEVISQILGNQGLNLVHTTAEEFLNKNATEYDIILLLGLLYHVANPGQLLISAAKHTKDMMVIDSQCINDDAPFLELRKESSHDITQGMAELVFLPSRGGIYWMMRDCGHRHIMELPNVGNLPKDYLCFNRCTFIMRRHKKIIKPDLQKQNLFLYDDELNAVFPVPDAASKLVRSCGQPRKKTFLQSIMRCC